MDKLKKTIYDMLNYNEKYQLLKLLSVFRNKKIEQGRNCYIDKSVQIINRSLIKIGDNVCIGMNSMININDDGTRKKRVYIGNNSYIGKDFFISSGEIVEIGDFFVAGPHCCIIGANHVFSDPFHPYLNAGPLELNKKIIIEENVWLGANVTILGNVRIGRGGVVSANSLITKDVPPFSIVYGNPAKVVKRYDFFKKKWVWESEISEMSNIPSREKFIQTLYDNEHKIDMPIPAATNRFNPI